jgi:hypothetical protein
VRTELSKDDAGTKPGSRVIVALGRHARRALAIMFDVDAAPGVTPIDIAGTERLLTFRPHPNARGVPKSFAKNLKRHQLRRLQSRLSEDRA